MFVKRIRSHTVKQQAASITEAFINHISFRVLTEDERSAQPLQGTGKTAQKKALSTPEFWG